MLFCATVSLCANIDNSAYFRRQKIFSFFVTIYIYIYIYIVRLPRWPCGKESSCQCRRPRRWWFDPWIRKVAWRRNDNLLHYSSLENPTDWESGRLQSMGHKELDMTKHTHTHRHTYKYSKVFGIKTLNYSQGMQATQLNSALRLA